MIDTAGKRIKICLSSGVIFVIHVIRDTYLESSSFGYSI